MRYSQLFEEPLKELKYPANVGIHEMMMFYKKASQEQKEKLEQLLSSGLTAKAWELITLVTGMSIDHPKT